MAGFTYCKTISPPFIWWWCCRQHQRHFTNIDKIYKLRFFVVFLQVGLSRYELHNKRENDYMSQIGIDSFCASLKNIFEDKKIMYEI